MCRWSVFEALISFHVGTDYSYLKMDEEMDKKGTLPRWVRSLARTSTLLV